MWGSKGYVQQRVKKARVKAAGPLYAMQCAEQQGPPGPQRSRLGAGHVP